MSSDTHDRMRRYESNQDSGDTAADTNADTNTATSSDPQPANTSPAPPDHLGNDASDNPDPIPMATPQSPVQTEDSPEVKEDDAPEVRSNKGSDNEASNESEASGGKEYREV